MYKIHKAYQKEIFLGKGLTKIALFLQIVNINIDTIIKFYFAEQEDIQMGLNNKTTAWLENKLKS